MKTMNKRFKTLLDGGLVLLFSLVAISYAGAQTCVQPPSGLVSWWPGNGNANDIVGGNNGTLQGNVAFVPGMVGQAFNFNGAAHSFVTVGSNNMLPSSNQFTIDAWIKPDFSQQNAIDTVLTKRDGCGGFGISYILHVIKFDPAFGGGHAGRPIGQLTLAMSDSSGSIVEATSGTTVVPNDGQFHHVAGTYDGSTMNVYLDGELVGQASRTGPIFSTTSAPVISHHGGTCPQRAAAVMDEIQFYDRALSEAEIEAIFDAGSAGQCITCTPPPLDMTGWWPGDGNTDDLVGGRNAVLRDHATTGPGFVNEGFILDGAGDFVEVPHDPALNVGTGDFTVDFWVYFNTTAGEQVLVEKYVENFGPAPPGWFLTKLPDNSLRFGTGPGPLVVNSPSLALPPNTWIHVAARRSSGVATILVNGTPVANGPLAYNADSASSLKFGHRGSPSDTPGSTDNRGFFLNGRMDEVELFVGRALSDAEIQDIVMADSAGKCKFPMEELTSLSPATLWIGLKNSDAVGLRLDLQAEVFLNETKVGEGALNNVTSGSSGFNNAKLNAIPLTLFAPVEVPADAELAMTLSVRRTCSGGGHNSGTPRLWYNGQPIDSGSQRDAGTRFGATIADTPSAFFLRDGFALSTTAGTAKKFVDVPVDNKTPCPNRPFTLFGTWSLTLP